MSSSRQRIPLCLACQTRLKVIEISVKVQECSNCSSTTKRIVGKKIDERVIEVQNFYHFICAVNKPQQKQFAVQWVQWNQ